MVGGRCCWTGMNWLAILVHVLHSHANNGDTFCVPGPTDQCSLREWYYWLPSGEGSHWTTNGERKRAQRKVIEERGPDDNEVDIGYRLMEKGKYDDSLAVFDRVIGKSPNNCRAHFGRGHVLELLSEAKRSNTFLEASIKAYEKVLELQKVPDSLTRETVTRLVDRARFRGWMNKAAKAQVRFLERFPRDSALRNELGVTYLMMGQNEYAKREFQRVLSEDPRNGFALVHYGFVLKTVEDNLQEGIEYMQRGIDADEEGTQDGRFYFHLGDALQRLNRSNEAYQLYERATSRGVFLSPMQRSLYNVPGLTGRPFWTMEETTYKDKLQAIQNQWRQIRKEALSLLDEETGKFKPEDEKLTKAGDWKQFTLYARGRAVSGNCARTPKTCAIVAQFPVASGCSRGQVKFSIMSGGTRVWPHCGPTNCRLRAHLGLIVPDGPRIRVGNETRTWQNGEFLIFDDSFEHEVWHEGNEIRLVLIIDFWHPELTKAQRASLAPI